MATVRYLVRDVDRAVAFYTSQLDFELIEQFGPAFAHALPSVSRSVLGAGPDGLASAIVAAKGELGE